MNMLDDMAKVDECINIYRYDNGWMVEVGGRDIEGEWVRKKLIFDNEERVLEVVREYNTKVLDK